MTENAPEKRIPFWREKTFITLVLGVVFVIAAGYLRFSDAKGVPESAFFVEKLDWNADADMVLAGDSRIYMGVSPQHLSDTLESKPRILNFGFNAVKYDDAYLNKVWEILDHDSDTSKMVLLGVSPSSVLTVDEGEYPCGYRTTIRARAKLNWMDYELRRIDPFFEPMKPKSLLYGLRLAKKKRRFYRHYYEDGWMSGHREPPKPGKATIALRAQLQPHRPIDQSRVDALVAFGKRCRDKGIKVFALRPPTCKDMVAAEDELTDFTKIQLKERLAAAGIVWLEVDQFAYRCFDDSHIVTDDAVRLSKDIGALINQALAIGAKANGTDIKTP